MNIYIKNMVCVRCKMLVKKILDDMGVAYYKIELGFADLKQPINHQQKQTLKSTLQIWGLELLEDSKEILVEKIKGSVIKMIRDDTEISPVKTSHYLSRYLHYNYNYLANVFSQETGICLSDYIIAHKIEKAKQMLMDENLTVSEIAWKLNYSSVAHLSNQFVKVTGLRPSQFKKSRQNLLTPLELVGMMEVA
ncbi:MAG: AraC family transcriptional regulator [Ferruginibacter sp.]